MRAHLCKIAKVRAHFQTFHFPSSSPPARCLRVGGALRLQRVLRVQPPTRGRLAALELLREAALELRDVRADLGSNNEMTMVFAQNIRNMIQINTQCHKYLNSSLFQQLSANVQS